MTNLPKRYRLYIDETGDSAFNRLSNPIHRYFGLLGVWLEQNADAKFTQNLKTFKESIFHETSMPVAFHRKDIINKKGAFGILREAEINQKFNYGLLNLLSNSEFRLICVLIDKKFLWEQYSNPADPYHYCLRAMLDRYCQWLKCRNAVGDVMAEARGKQFDRLLELEYKRFFEENIAYGHEQKRVLTSSSIKFSRKTDHQAGVELADILAYPIKQNMLITAELIEESDPNFSDMLIRAIKGKYHKNERTEEINGYGLVWIPKDVKK